jgi:hypothetical protein
MFRVSDAKLLDRLPAFLFKTGHKESSYLKNRMVGFIILDPVS